MGIFKDLMWHFKQERWSYLCGTAILVLVSLLNLVPPYAVGRVVDRIREGSLTRGELALWLLLILAIAAIVYGLRYLWRILIFGAAAKLGRILRDRLYAFFTRMPPSFFHQRRVGELMAHATNDVQAVELTAGEGILTLVDSLSMGGLVIISMALINWKLTLIALLPMPFMAWATSRYGALMHRRFHEAQAAFSSLSDKVQANVTGMRVIKAFGQEEAEIAAFQELAGYVADKNLAVSRIDSLFGPTITLFVGFSFFLTVAFGAYFVLNTDLTIGALTAFTMYLGHLIWPMLAFGMLFNIMERGRASYERIRSLLSVSAEVGDREGAREEILTGDIEYAVERFIYPGKELPALRNIHVAVRRGQTLGVAGKTGSGKTTFLRLLLREFDVQEGEIRIGGISIRDVKLDPLRRAIGYVPQDPFLFSATVAENIAFGRPDAPREEMEKAARLAAIHEEILRFENGYETPVGERGVTLSGGQKQRLSIARALLLDPEILILDNALSAVDARTEEEILRALKENRLGRTTIIAAHRLSAIEHADWIIVLEEGRIIEQGTHRELMEARGWYAHTYRRQKLESLIAQGGDAVHE